METTNIGNTAHRMPLENDWRFAELIAATWLEPELSARYTENPGTVLAEFGMFLEKGETAPALPAAVELNLLVEEFERLPEITTAMIATWCTAPSASIASAVVPAVEAARA